MGDLVSIVPYRWSMGKLSAREKWVLPDLFLLDFVLLLVVFHLLP